MFSSLDVVNACLGAMGRAPVQSLAATTNRFIATALTTMQRREIALQSTGWYFNTERLTVSPSAGSQYLVPADVISVQDQEDPAWLILRGRVLYTRDGAPLTGTDDIVVNIVRLVPFDDLPVHAQLAIMYDTVSHFTSNYDGDQIKIRDANAARDSARMDLMAEHTRITRANMLTQGSVGAIRHRNKFVTYPRRRY